MSTHMPAAKTLRNNLFWSGRRHLDTPKETAYDDVRARRDLISSAEEPDSGGLPYYPSRVPLAEEWA
jgi:hypothetical protein